MGCVTRCVVGRRSFCEVPDVLLTSCHRNQIQSRHAQYLHAAHLSSCLLCRRNNRYTFAGRLVPVQGADWRACEIISGWIHGCLPGDLYGNELGWNERGKAAVYNLRIEELEAEYSVTLIILNHGVKFLKMAWCPVKGIAISVLLCDRNPNYGPPNYSSYLRQLLFYSGQKCVLQ